MVRRSNKRRILIVMMDGFDPAYLQASDMPNTKRMIANGFHKTVKGIMPSVTNVNNTGIGCGGPPSLHGITANPTSICRRRRRNTWTRRRWCWRRPCSSARPRTASSRH
jgi:hypothetical protein